MGLVYSLFGKIARKLSKGKERHPLYESDFVFVIVLTLIICFVDRLIVEAMSTNGL